MRAPALPQSERWPCSSVRRGAQRLPFYPPPWRFLVYRCPLLSATWRSLPLVPVIGAACWGTGTLAWMLGYSMRDVAGWWLAFLVLTIAAERLELSRLLAPPRINRLAFALTVA